MYILGLTLGHTATASLLKDGKIIRCVSEERFARVKNKCGFPKQSIDWILKDCGLKISDLDKVVITNDAFFSENYGFTQRFLMDYTQSKFFRKLKARLGYRYPKLFDRYYSNKEKKIISDQKSNSEDVIERVSKILEIPRERIYTVGHHKAHALSTCFNLPQNKESLIFTLDGEGPEGLCATVSVYNGKDLNTISQTKKTASLGYLYAIATIYLGMKPLEHEFKVMGLAPYAKKDKVDELFEKKFKGLLRINDELEFESKFNLVFSDVFFDKELKFVRFDNIAGAVQKLTEEITSEWIKKSIGKTNINNIALSGGVFMNVKANQKIAEMPEVNEIFIMPSCGDEANAIGACFYGYKKFCDEKELKFEPKPITDLYLGPKYDNDYIENLIAEKNLNEKYKIKKIKEINKEVAKLLARGNIVARCSGKSEWGARALGNRSILANAADKDTIRILNETIKDRDFWMPFTPSILDKYEKKYIKNPKKLFAPYMVVTFDSTDLAKKDIPAAMHPYDQTVRPQIVTKKYNPDYYEIIEEYSKLSGFGGILNTSFNLHGEPNVLNPEDALHTVENSDLKYLVMGNYLFEKKI